MKRNLNSIVIYILIILITKFQICYLSGKIFILKRENKGQKVKKKRKFEILRTFEIFNRESLSVLKDKFIEIVLIETENIFSKASINLFNVDLKKDDSVQITVINDNRTYDLLSNTWKRFNKKKNNGINDEKNKNRKLYNKLNVS